MSTKLDEIISKARKERQRQFDLPGSEWDSTNSPGDWAAIIGHYVTEEVRRNGITPLKEDFEDSLIKAMAVIIAALEHTEVMKDRGELQ